MNRFHCYVARTTDAQYAMQGHKGEGAGYHVVTTGDVTKAIRANTLVELMRELGVQYRRFYPVLVQIETEVISQDKWPSESEVWGAAHAD